MPAARERGWGRGRYGTGRSPSRVEGNAGEANLTRNRSRRSQPFWELERARERGTALSSAAGLIQVRCAGGGWSPRKGRSPFLGARLEEGELFIGGEAGVERSFFKADHKFGIPKTVAAELCEAECNGCKDVAFPTGRTFAGFVKVGVVPRVVVHRVLFPRGPVGRHRQVGRAQGWGIAHAERGAVGAPGCRPAAETWGSPCAFQVMQYGQRS